MCRVEGLDDRATNNIDKTGLVIAKNDRFQIVSNSQPNTVRKKSNTFQESENLGKRLLALDQKVSDIDDKLSVLKNQLDSNSLQGEDINAEASEKRSVSMNVIEITKTLNTEMINHVTKELGQLKDTTGGVDKKLQFHINLVQENLGEMLNLVTDVHHRR